MSIPPNKSFLPCITSFPSTIHVANLLVFVSMICFLVTEIQIWQVHEAIYIPLILYRVWRLSNKTIYNSTSLSNMRTDYQLSGCLRQCHYTTIINKCMPPMCKMFTIMINCHMCLKITVHTPKHELLKSLHAT